ncbi:unnamed protein product [Calypogeia fissa]
MILLFRFLHPSVVCGTHLAQFGSKGTLRTGALYSSQFFHPSLCGTRLAPHAAQSVAAAAAAAAGSEEQEVCWMC